MYPGYHYVFSRFGSKFAIYGEVDVHEGHGEALESVIEGTLGGRIISTRLPYVLGGADL